METGPIKTLVERHPAAMALGSVVVLLLAGFWIIRSIRASAEPPQPGYFFDLQTGKVFVAPTPPTVPMKAESGEGNGVAVVVLSCGSCANPDERWLGWLARYTDEANAVLAKADDPEKLDPQARAVVDAGLLVAPVPSGPGEIVWMSSKSPEAQQLRDDVTTRCPGGAPVRPCRP